MTSEKTTRGYRMRRRAELQEQTRLRITEAAVELHGTLGPARTSVKAVAELAGVERATVYRHFPDEEALFIACTGHWRASNPLPDLEGWAAIADADERLSHALGELYAYYRSTQRMMANVLRDEALSPLVARMLAGYYDYLAAARDALMARRTARGGARQRTRAAIGHALAFATWRSLTLEQGLDDSQAADLMRRMVAHASG
jgi:AcrR family transcriptional regulator